MRSARILVFVLFAGTTVFWLHHLRSQRTSSGTANGDPASSLAVGTMAPDIEGEDQDGKKFALREYRGKVVVLDFWGNW